MTMSDEARFGSALLGALGPDLPAPDPTQLRVMFAYYAGVVEANQRLNLTRVVDPAEAAVKHFADTLSLLGWVQADGIGVGDVLDVGTGAGFPAVPLAVMRPDWRVTAVDSTAKKVRFVSEMAACLSLDNLSAAHHRAGQWEPPRRFDLVTYKAVGDLRRCVEQSRHLVTPGGYAVAYKTGALRDPERHAGIQAARRRAFEVLQPYAYQLRSSGETIARALWIFRRL